MAVIGFIVLPIVWSVPEALVTAGGRLEAAVLLLTLMMARVGLLAVLATLGPASGTLGIPSPDSLC